MKISESDVQYVASLAMLEVAENEKKELADQLSRIVEYVEQLNKLDVSGIEPTAQVVTSVKHAVREDRVVPRTGSSEAGKTVKLFKVPKVITEQMNLNNITADKLVALYKNKDLSVTEVIRSTYEEVERVDKDIRAFISLCPERALEEARRVDAKLLRANRWSPWPGCRLRSRTTWPFAIFRRPADRGFLRIMSRRTRRLR